MESMAQGAILRAATPATFRASESRAELAPTMPSAAEIVAKHTSVEPTAENAHREALS